MAPTTRKNPVPSQRKCILTLGMHRSGTSALTRIVSMLGATLPTKLIGAGLGNELGHWEPFDLVLYHDQMLSDMDSYWYDWTELRLADLPIDQRLKIENDIQKIICASYRKSDLICLKDPRICRFADFFIDVLKAEGWQVAPVIALRNPLEVIDSLLERRAVWPEYHNRTDAALLWLTHMLTAEKATRGLPRAIVSYEAVLGDPIEAINKIVTQLELEIGVQVAHVAAGISGFISASHRHHTHNLHDISLESGLASWLSETYSAFLDLEASRNVKVAMATLDRVKREFSSSELILREIAAERRKAVAKATAAAEAARAAENERGQLWAQISNLQLAADKANQRAAEAVEELSRTRANVQKLDEEVKLLRSSIFWKATVPLREIARAASSAHRFSESLTRRIRRFVKSD